jgi:hypothetical protein
MTRIELAAKSAGVALRPSRAVRALTTIAACAAIIMSAYPAASLADAKQKHFKATRAYVLDQQTGRARMPTESEVAAVVADLTTLASRSTEGLSETTATGGAIAVDLAGGFGGVVLARPAANGAWETLCVFSLEEGAEFLGLVEDTAAQ